MTEVSKAQNNGSLNHSGGNSGTKSTVGAIFRSQKVHPMLLAPDDSFEFIEVRPGRTLRVYRSHSLACQNQTTKSQNKPASCPESNGVESSGIAIQHESATNPHDVAVPNCISCSQTYQNKKEISPNDELVDNDLAGMNDTKESFATQSDPDLKESCQKCSTTTSSIHFHIQVASSNSCINTGPTENSPDESLVDKTAVFLLHGVGGSVEIWNRQINYFEKLNYDIVAMDFIGHGLSSSPREPRAYMFKEISEDILAIFDRFHKTSNIIVGHSYGCCFSTLLARYRSRFITKLVLISGGSPLPLSPEWDFRCLPLCLLSCCQQTLRNIFLKRSFHSFGYTDPAYNAAFNIPTHVLKYIMNGQDWSEGNIDFHSWITIPTLLIHGKQDRMVSAEEVNLMNQEDRRERRLGWTVFKPRELERQQIQLTRVEFLERSTTDVAQVDDVLSADTMASKKLNINTIPGSQLHVVEDAGHMVMIEKSEMVNQMVHDFLLTSILSDED